MIINDSATSVALHQKTHERKKNQTGLQLVIGQLDDAKALCCDRAAGSRKVGSPRGGGRVINMPQ